MFLKLYQRYTNNFAKIRQQLSVSFNKVPLQSIAKNNTHHFQQTLIGLDINTNSIIWTQIAHIQGQVAQLITYKILDLHENPPITHDILKNLAHETLSTKIALGVAIPNARVQITTLTLDAHLSYFALRKIFKEKSIALLNRPMKEIYFQYHVLGFVKNQPNDLHFLLIAVPKKEITDILNVLKTSHLSPQLIDVESFARERGQMILKNQQLQLNAMASQQADRLAVSIGLAMHPRLKK
jgi:Tfp pilus assembly PilM family ATPase